MKKDALCLVLLIGFINLFYELILLICVIDWFYWQVYWLIISIASIAPLTVTSTVTSSGDPTPVNPSPRQEEVIPKPSTPIYRDTIPVESHYWEDQGLDGCGLPEEDDMLTL